MFGNCKLDLDVPRRPLVKLLGGCLMMRTYMGRYEAKRLLGEGGMGRVYLAREYNPDRYVVVKVMHEHLVGDERFRNRFLRETSTMARLDHPHAVKLLD